jgi:hypothetical protein
MGKVSFHPLWSKAQSYPTLGQERKILLADHPSMVEVHGLCQAGIGLDLLNHSRGLGQGMFRAWWGHSGKD